MKQLRYFLFLAGLLCAYVGLQAQSSSSSTYIVTSVTMRIDSVQTVQQMEQLTALFKSHKEIRDFDIKGEKCNFTMEPNPNLLTIIEQELQAEGYTSEYLYIRDNQTFTSVPFEDKKGPPLLRRDETDPRNTNDSIRIRYENGN